MSVSSEPVNPSVRPKRRPAYLQDYEVGLQSFRKSASPVSTREQPVESSDDDYSSSQFGASAAKPKREHSLHIFSSPSRLTVRDKHRDRPSLLQQHISSPAHQTSPQYPNRELQFESNAEFVPLGDEVDGYQSDRSDVSSLKLQRISEENLKLRETQQAIQADLKRIETAKDELIQLLDRACSLQRPLSMSNTRSDHPSVKFHHAADAGDEGWPEPPPPIAYDEPENINQCGKQMLYSTTRATPTLTPRLTSVEQTRDFSYPSTYDNQLRYGQYPARQIDPPYAPPGHLYPEQHRRASYNVSPPVASVDLTEKYYKGPSPTIPYFRTKDPSEFARLKIALDNLLPPDSTEMFKYQVLVDHLKLDDACLIADSFLHSPTPYRDTMLALIERFGQPHQVALRRIATILDSPDISRNDPSAFEKFSLQVQSLVGLLKTLNQAGSMELHCGSHVACLLNKLPPERRADFRRHMLHRPGVTYSLVDLAEWLKYESWCQSYDDQTAKGESRAKRDPRVAPRTCRTTATVLTGSGNRADGRATAYSPANVDEKAKGRPMIYCSYCQNSEHAFSQCPKIPTLTKDQLSEWIRANRRCWRCGLGHQAAHCGLKKPCPLCQRKHLRILHEVNERPVKDASKTEVCLVSSATQTLYLNKPVSSNKVLLKVVRVLLHHGNCTLDTFAILDDGSERTMLLPEAAQKLGLRGTVESLALRTIRYDVQTLKGVSVSFHISPYSNPKKRYLISRAFTAPQLDLIDHSYPISKLQKQYKHLAGLPLQCFEKAKPLILVGADQTHMISPIEPVRLGPRGGPAAIRTKLGWTLQGPTSLLEQQLKPKECLYISLPPSTTELFKNVNRLWQVDVLPFQNERECTRSKQNQRAVELLEAKTVRGAQLKTQLQKELTLPLRHAVLWTDSTTVLSWIQSESCHFKVFVGTRVAEIRELTNTTNWRYVNSVQNPADDLTRGKTLKDLAKPIQNPADDLTRGKTLKDLAKPNRWSQGPPFLLLSSENWPTNPTECPEIDKSELKKSAFCGVVAVDRQFGSEYKTWTELVKAIAQELHGAAGESGEPTANTYQTAEMYILQKVQKIRRQFWVLRGRAAIRILQHACTECQRLRAKPTFPKMADLPLARLRFYKPAFHSTGMDCFGPFLVKIGRRVEKRWGILYKCLTTRAVHIDLLNSLDTDSFLMSLRRFIARRGSPVELLSDQGTDFRGGERELCEAFQAMSPDLQRKLAPQKIGPLSSKDWSTSRKEVGNPLQVSYHPSRTHRPAEQLGHRFISDVTSEVYCT
ncbi:uncharacterized protein [Sinocyclocheilus grahami]|uniref:uncharacterized protein n=1 Tax=Sinocyclocheilus grahami TaxID=75366 RepID=UPI0007AC7920|nr:PREDICTED: uncharacterized protein LOC107593486 [Sinocyclocheilus grahami]